MTVLKCEDEEVKLGCPEGNTIRIVTAMYGRLNQKDCLKRRGFTDTNCKSEQSVVTVKKRCEGKQTCCFTVNNKMLDDPCPGTYKYLKIKYQCISRRGRL